MTYAQFQMQFAPVIEAFPGKDRFPTIVLERIHQRVSDFSVDQMEMLCNLVIDHCEHAPRVQKVLEWAGVVRSKTQQEGPRSSWSQPDILCQKCNDLGVICATFRDDALETLMKCDCAAGKTCRYAIPVWEYKYGQLFTRAPCPISWFKPLPGEKIQNRRMYWQQKTSFAEQYWEQARAQQEDAR